jgi:C-terminal processing protease CtpA/Prc
LIGTRTFGAGTLLQPFPLRDGSALLLAVAEWRTPKGRQVWHKGLSPDIEAALPCGARVLTPEAAAELDACGLANCGDVPLLKALDVLRGRLRD